MHNHHFWWRFFPKKELTQVYLSAATRYFAVSLVSLFVPIYFYKELGYSLNQTLFFFIVYALALALTTPFAAKFSARYGCRYSILISVPLYIFFLLLLYLLPMMRIPLSVIAILLGSSLAFYWMGMHIIFRKASDKKHRGEEFGKRESISVLSTMVGPLLGGFLISVMGFKPVFILAGILLFVSAFFLFLGKEEHARFNLSLRSLFVWKHWKDYLFFISRGTRVIIDGVVWPLLLFVVLDNYLSLGIIGSILAGISAFLLWIVGKYSDHFDRRKLLHCITGFETVSWIMRAFSITIVQVFGATLFGSVTYGIYESAAGTLEYDKAKGDKTAYFVSREIFICVGRVLGLLFVIVTGSLAGGLIFHSFANLAAFLF